MSPSGGRSLTDATSLRVTSRRLTFQFAALIIALYLIVAGLVIALVAVNAHNALMQRLVDAEHISSPRDAPPGTFVAMQGRGGQDGPAASGSDGDTGENANGDAMNPLTADGIQVSPNAPNGFPELTTFNEVAITGKTIEQTLFLSGESYLVRTDADSGQVIQVAVDSGDNARELLRVVVALGLAGVFGIAAAVAMAWWMSRRAMRPLADALTLQRRFVADAGHELRTPVTLLSTRAQLLRRELTRMESSGSPLARSPESSAARPTPVSSSVSIPSDALEPRSSLTRGVDEIVTDAKALTGILDDLLVAADPRQDAERSEVDLVAVAQAVVQACLAEAQQRGMTLSCRENGPVVVTGVPAALRRLLTALVSNGLDHAASAVVVTVQLVEGRNGRSAWNALDSRNSRGALVTQNAGKVRRGGGRQAQVEVADDGSGFPSGASERVFRRFASTRDASVEHGSRHYGLGLALAQEIAHRHAGSVELVRPGEPGGRVRVSLPMGDS